MEKWLESEEIYSGSIFSVRTGRVTLDDGDTAIREVIHHQGSVAIVPVLDDRAVLLVRQYRIAVEKEILEIPAGRIEDSDRNAEEAARRELEEEIGYRAKHMVLGPAYYSSVGFLDEKVQVFLAFGLEKTKHKRDRSEKIDVVEMPLEEAAVAVNEMRFDDSKTLIGLRELFAYLTRPDMKVTAANLYAWYADENHKYNTLIWQFPAAIVGFNLFALANEQFLASRWATGIMFVVNCVLLACVAKHVYHQRCFTKSLRILVTRFKVAEPTLPIVEFPREGIYALSRVPVAWLLVGALAALNLLYLAPIFG